MLAALGEVAQLHQHLVEALRSKGVRETQIDDTSSVRDAKHGGADLLFLLLGLLCILLLVLVFEMEDAHKGGKRHVVLLAGVAILDLHIKQ